MKDHISTLGGSVATKSFTNLHALENDQTCKHIDLKKNFRKKINIKKCKKKCFKMLSKKVE